MMTPAQILTATLEQLRATREEMLSAEWTLGLEDETEDTRRQSARILLQVQHAILTLENAKLADIRTKLVANEEALTEGTAKLQQALADIEDTAEVLEAIGAFLQIVGQVASLLAL